ncbi:MAG: zinc metalloprotease HtpX [candidate division WOR-3 bacterium]
MMGNTIKTFLFLAILSVLLVYAGKLIGGSYGMIIALFMAALMNFIAWFFSDKIATASVGAREVSEEEAPELHALVEEVAVSAGIPKPKIYIAPIPQPNAFATGRNPKNAAVVFTEGILRLLNRRELKGVIAHEIAHIKNRDILIMSVAATLAAAIVYIADMLRWGLIFFGGRDRDRNPLALLVAIILLPIAAMLIKLAISRSREYIADETGARFINDPLALASALEKLAYGTQAVEAEVPEFMSHMFIVNPLSGGFLMELFSTHPPVEKRIERLKRLAENLY